MIFMTGHGGCSSRYLSFRNCRSLLDHHAARFDFRPGAARRETHHAERNNFLRIEAELKRFER